MSDIGDPFKTLPNAWAQAAITDGAIVAGSQIGKAAKITRFAQGVYVMTCDAGGFQEPDTTHLTASYEMSVRIASTAAVIWVLDSANTTNTLKQILCFDAAGAAVDIVGNILVAIRRLAV